MALIISQVEKIQQLFIREFFKIDFIACSHFIAFLASSTMVRPLFQATAWPLSLG
jgi:hypothetical protein